MANVKTWNDGQVLYAADLNSLGHSVKDIESKIKTVTFLGTEQSSAVPDRPAHYMSSIAINAVRSETVGGVITTFTVSGNNSLGIIINVVYQCVKAGGSLLLIKNSDDSSDIIRLTGFVAQNGFVLHSDVLCDPIFGNDDSGNLKITGVAILIQVTPDTSNIVGSCFAGSQSYTPWYYTIE